MVTNQKVILMNAKETKAKMDKVVKVRKLLAKLDREIFGLRGTLNELHNALDDDSTVSCTIELDDIEVWNQICKWLDLDDVMNLIGEKSGKPSKECGCC
tara:strand:- start:2019 stop:2315 length:297 start_codon:yes stop_codon:yes gene_type:complete